ncbi:MAG: hypothetical protein JWQ22_2115 [Devosia sp.]|nr:hypothetical protein [Devosia sp.]
MRPMAEWHEVSARLVSPSHETKMPATKVAGTMFNLTDLSSGIRRT